MSEKRALGRYSELLDFVLSDSKRMTESNASKIEELRAECQESGIRQEAIFEAYRKACQRAGEKGNGESKSSRDNRRKIAYAYS